MLKSDKEKGTVKTSMKACVSDLIKYNHSKRRVKQFKV